MHSTKKKHTSSSRSKKSPPPRSLRLSRLLPICSRLLSDAVLGLGFGGRGRMAIDFLVLGVFVLAFAFGCGSAFVGAAVVAAGVGVAFSGEVCFFLFGECCHCFSFVVFVVFLCFFDVLPLARVPYKRRTTSRTIYGTPTARTELTNKTGNRGSDGGQKILPPS